MNWYMYYDKNKDSYQLSNMDDCNWIAQFKSFDMAYEYASRMNGGKSANETYSRWTIQAR